MSQVNVLNSSEKPHTCGKFNCAYCALMSRYILRQGVWVQPGFIVFEEDKPLRKAKRLEKGRRIAYKKAKTFKQLGSLVK